MKLETCFFSGYKIHPGHGIRMCRTDGRVMIFLSAKCEHFHKLKKNPRKTAWTVLYRRKHKKGTLAEEISKKRTRKTQKFHRPIGTTALADILAKRNQKPEVRRAQREQAIKAAKEKSRTAKSTKKTEKAKKQAQQAGKTKPTKPMGKQAPRAPKR